MRPWSCDTFVALSDTGPDGRVLVGKNSDRPVGDTQPLRFLPRRTAGETGGRLRLAYVEIDDAADSAAHLGGSPYWCWGHEQGVNEHGVVIGNEALFTRDWAAAVRQAEQGGAGPERGLLGMELVRLGLERGRTAQQSLETICALVERHGQWGSGTPGAPDVSGGYDNSFLIADSREAWVLETSGRNWVARRATSGAVAVSNQPTIRTEWDRASGGLVDHAVRHGWWDGKDGEAFDFARAYVDPGTPLQLSHIRLQRSRQLLRAAVADGGQVDVPAARRILRDHYEETFLDGPYFNAAVPDFLTLCMHSHPADFTWGDTAASSVFVLPTEEQRDSRPAHVWWAAVTPCTGVYVPVFVDAGAVPEVLSAAGTAGLAPRRPEEAPRDSFAAGSYWWRFRDLLERVKGEGPGAPEFTRNQPVVRETFDVLEQRWSARLPQVEDEAVALRKAGREEEMRALLRAFTADCVTEALGTADALIARIRA